MNNCILNAEDRKKGKLCRSMECKECPKYRVTKQYTIGIDKIDLTDKSVNALSLDQIATKINEVIEYLEKNIE